MQRTAVAIAALLAMVAMVAMPVGGEDWGEG